MDLNWINMLDELNLKKGLSVSSLVTFAIPANYCF